MTIVINHLIPFSSSILLTRFPFISFHYNNHPSILHFNTKTKYNFHKSLQLTHSSISMASDEIAHDYSPFLRIYKDGRVERLIGVDISPTCLDPITQVQSKDIIFSPQENLSARLYLPKNVNPNTKLPLLVYYHGGGFCVETPFASKYHNHLNNLVSEINVVAVSVDYRRVPEHPLPIGYEDSWKALQWVSSHCNRDGEEEWLNKYVDFDKIFLGGDSAGANIAHYLALRNGEERLKSVNIVGIVLVHPYFWGKEPIGNEPKEPEKRQAVDKIWYFACPSTKEGNDDPWINPIIDPKLSNLGCKKVLVIVAEKDLLRDRGWFYCEKLKNCGWDGIVQFMEIKEEGHVFHLEKSGCENAIALLKRISSFINQN